MSEQAAGPGWWQASDGRWYPPEQHPDPQYRAQNQAPPPGAGPAPPPYGQAPYPAQAEPYAPGRGPVGRPRSTGLTILLSIVTLGIWTWVWSFQNGEELKNYRRDGLGGGIYLVLAIFVSPVVMFLIAGEVEKLYQEEGEQPPITTLWGLWFLLPLIGNIIWYVRIQRSLNEFWARRGAGPASGV